MQHFIKHFCIILLLQLTFIFNRESIYLDYPIVNATRFNMDGSPLLGGIFDSNECLLPTKDAKSILEKDYGVQVTPDKRQRFILGQCYPVIFVPGIFANRLSVTVNCKKIKADEPNRMKEIRVFCGNSVVEMNQRKIKNMFFSLLFWVLLSL